MVFLFGRCNVQEFLEEWRSSVMGVLLILEDEVRLAGFLFLLNPFEGISDRTRSFGWGQGRSS